MTGTTSGRVLSIDLGARRVGLAISDPSRTLARPLTTLTVTGQPQALTQVLAAIASLSVEDDGLAEVVIGVPVMLDGLPSDQTRAAKGFAGKLRAAIALPVVEQDERLSSHEAESRLSVNERDWRRRKARLDAAAAAVILQDYLDRGGR